MEGLYRPTDLFLSPLAGAEVLTPIRWDEHEALTILAADDTEAAILLSNNQFPIIPRDDLKGLATKCGLDRLTIEVLSAPMPIGQVSDRPFGWLVVCADGFAIVCSAAKPNVFNHPILVSLTSGKVLENAQLHRDAIVGIKEWRLLAKSDGISSPTVIFEHISAPNQTP